MNIEFTKESLYQAYLNADEEGKKKFHELFAANWITPDEQIRNTIVEMLKNGTFDEEGMKPYIDWLNNLPLAPKKKEVEGFVDLGLTSGTLWARENASIDGKNLFTFDEAVKNFGDEMPTAAQIVEMATECKSEWKTIDGKKGRVFTGPNGNQIFIPADGYIDRDGRKDEEGSEANVWSKTPYSAAYACYLYFNSGYVSPLDSDSRAYGFSVRPVR